MNFSQILVFIETKLCCIAYVIVASIASPLSHCVSGTESGLSCLRLLASVQLNSNMSESLRHLCVPPCVHCVPCLPLYVFHCAKIDSVLTQPTQGKKRIVGARLNTAEVQNNINKSRQIKINVEYLV